ncbi:hypothetical protein JCM10212_006515 [Sporobolomyces blumeae]
MPSTPREFLERLIALVELEQEAERVESHLLTSNCSLSLLQKAGLALINLSPSSSSSSSSGSASGPGRTLVELTREPAWHVEQRFPPHEFRVGDIARIRTTGNSNASGGNGNGTSGSKTSSSSGATAGGRAGRNKGSAASKAAHGGTATDEGGIDAVVYKTGEYKIVVAVDESNDEVDWPDKVTIVKTTNPSTFTRQIFFLRQAIRRLERPLDSSAPEEAAPPSRLEQVLFGLASPTLDPATRATSKDSMPFFDAQLNESQKEAVEFALRSREVAMVWGPPGTGKTQTLVEIIRQMVVTHNLRVLVCGASNLSVDNILARLSIPPRLVDAPRSLDPSAPPTPPPSVLRPIPLTRLGHPARVLASLTPHTLDSQTSTSDASQLVADIQSDLSVLERELASKDRKTRLKGSERKKKWDEVKELRKDMRKRMGGVVAEVVGKAKVVLATTHGAGGKTLDKHEFDVVIIDEAAQATEPACWIPIARGKKLILAGDHLQLPPTLKSLNASNSSSSPSALDPAASSSSLSSSTSYPTRLRLPSTLEETLFSRLLSLHGPSLRRMLRTQYRFNSKINEFPSSELYGGHLVPDESVESRSLSQVVKKARCDDAQNPQRGDEDEDLNEPVVFFDTAGLAMYERTGEEGGYGSESKSNENEAEIVLNYVDFLISSGVPATSISLISPYSSQVTLLSSLVSSRYPEIEIGSIDSNQGRENDVVIMSLVRSNDEGEIGFLKESRRLNVAMTRARCQLVVVGDSETLRKGGDKTKGSNRDGEKKEKDKVDRAHPDEEALGRDTDTDQGGGGGELENKMGARYLRDWIDWLEENAYVRAP